jgi:MFS family permease
MAGEYPKRWIALIGISILSFVVFIDFIIVNTILPGIQRDLHASVDELQWVMNAFFLMLTVFMVTMGRLGDIFGRRRVFYTGVIIFALASFMAPLYLQTVRNEIPYVAGLMLLPISSLVVIVPPVIGKLVDRHGPMTFIVAGQAILAIAALVQIYFEPTSPVWLVLLGLGLFGFGWGLQQATSALAATSTFPPASAGLIIGVLYSIWNFGSSLGLAIGGLIFEELDRRSLTSTLAQRHITLSGPDQDLVRSLLSDPSQALKVLGKLTGGLEAEILPIFRHSLMTGYSGAMVYLLVTCTLGAVLVPFIARKTAPAA